MNWENIIVILASSIAVSISTYYLKKGNSRKIEKDKHGNFNLRLPKIYKYIGVLSLLIISVFLIATIIYQENIWYFMSAIMTALFGGLGIPCLLGYKNYKVELNDENITVSNWRKKKTQIRWSEIREIKFNAVSGYIKLYGNNKTLKINHHLDGLNLLKDKIDGNTKWNSKELKIP